MEKEEVLIKNTKNTKTSESIQDVDLSTLLYIQPTFFSLIETRYKQIEKKQINIEEKKNDETFTFPVFNFIFIKFLSSLFPFKNLIFLRRIS